ncbi:MAG: hypothetical protein ACOYWZ_21030 [Bacillota bacterium]
MISILIIIIMSLLGISLMAVTISSLKMSYFYSDLNSSYFLAEAAAEEVAKNLDQKVSDIQESSRAAASDDIQLALLENPITLRDPDGSVGLWTTQPEHESKLEQEFKTKYFNYFYTNLDNEFLNIGTLDYMKQLLNTTFDDGLYAYKDIGADNGRLFLEGASYDSVSHTVNIKVSSLYNGYKKKLDVVFDLIPETGKTPYQPVEKSRVKKPVRHEILKKAIVTQKNMITSGGNVVINGDVLSFGTVPAVDDTLPPSDRQEDQSAPWYRYGGIIVGMCEDVALRSTEFDFDSSKTGLFSNGSLTINGSASTMGYVHSLYSTSMNPSSISISGDTYARSARSERYSNYSTLSFNNLSTIDNLQIDSNGTVLDVNGVYKGFVDTWHAIDGSSGTASLDDELKPKRTSSVVVNGDSYLNFKDAIYIGGSTFFKNYLDAGANPYMSGISALKSTRRVSSAFIKNDSSNPENKLFWYENGTYVEPPPQGYFKTYTYGTDPVDMLAGRASDPDYFPLINRAMHFKRVWELLWQPDEIYSTYINPDNINITGNGITSDGKLRGYSNGAIIANGKVYDVFEFEELHDPSSFHLNIQKPAIEAYYNQIKGLLAESYDPSLPRLNFVAPTRTIGSYIDNNFVGTNRIVPNKPYLPFDINKGIVYYGNTDAEIQQIGGNWYINSELMPIMKGIIYVDGNIYIRDGFNFTGILMSSKNIVFLGNANVSFDQLTVDSLLTADVNINGFFSLLTYEIPNETLKSQRVSTRNIKVVKWKEIK